MSRKMRLYIDSLLLALKLQKSLRLIFKHHMLEFSQFLVNLRNLDPPLVGLILLFLFSCFVFMSHLSTSSSWQTSSGRNPAGLVLHILCTVGSLDLPMLDDHPLPCTYGVGWTSQVAVGGKLQVSTVSLGLGWDRTKAIWALSPSLQSVS